MEERATGIILRTRPFTETSLIVQWITAEAGRIATVAKGARRGKSPFAGKLDLFYAADFSFQRSRRSELHALREVQLQETNARLRQELAWVHQASYFAVLIELGTEAETPLPEVYELFRSALGALPQLAPGGRMLHAFELKLLTILGYEPDLSVIAGEPQRLVRQLIETGFGQLDELEASPGSYRLLSAFVLGAVGNAFGRVPAQREKALKAIKGLNAVSGAGD